MCPSHWKKQSVCFYYLSHFYFTFCDLGEKKKKKSEASYHLVIIVAFMVAGQSDAITEKADHVSWKVYEYTFFPPSEALKYWRIFSCNIKSPGC